MRPTLRGACTGAAWLSSARVVRCPVKSGNERNPRYMLYVSYGTAGIEPEEGGMTSSQHGLYIRGYTHATMASTMGRKIARWSQSSKLVSVQIVGCNPPT